MSKSKKKPTPKKLQELGELVLETPLYEYKSLALKQIAELILELAPKAKEELESYAKQGFIYLGEEEEGTKFNQLCDLMKNFDKLQTLSFYKSHNS